MHGFWVWMTLLISIEIYVVEEISAARTPGGFQTGRITRASIYKAVLTQRGYIQFLRWQLSVPEINEFTFCEWVKSTNLTYPHSIFSYSKNGTDRLVRAWISPFGRSIHLEINKIEIMAEPTIILENQWYHICQSWDNREGRYGLWIDGKIKVDDTFPEMAGQVIPAGGDIVVGQEYTDFDKGLEEGIEGAVLGFNLLLVSAFDVESTFIEINHLDDGRLMAPINFPKFPVGGEGISSGRRRPIYPNYPPSAMYARKPGNPRALRIRGTRQAKQVPLGLRLIETGYYHCEEGRGSPYLGGSKLLISWTRTPVRVFGGALLKNVDSQCRIFNA
uniref:PTX3 protein n=1 Tax=Fopius arisanus TaxID=64838 RepID=A0A0C9RZ06_9HYME